MRAAPSSGRAVVAHAEHDRGPVLLGEQGHPGGAGVLDHVVQGLADGRGQLLDVPGR